MRDNKTPSETGARVNDVARGDTRDAIIYMLNNLMCATTLADKGANEIIIKYARDSRPSLCVVPHHTEHAVQCCERSQFGGKRALALCCRTADKDERARCDGVAILPRRIMQNTIVVRAREHTTLAWVF